MFFRNPNRKSVQFIFAVAVFINCYIFLINKVAFENQLSDEREVDRNVIGDVEEKIDWHDYKFMVYEASRVGPGESGAPYKLNDSVAIELNQKGHQEEGFATVVSETISPNRSLPDVRLEVCKTKKYLRDLPTTSVVVNFFNEPWSLLLRCIHSIYNRTPPELLHEIILTNDNSTNVDLFFPFEAYVAASFGGKVKLLENKERKGLILSRMEGALRATGDVVVFLDSHMEVTANWLPPLLEPIAMNPKTATVPILDSFSPFTLEYERLGHGTRGGFDWNMIYKWFPMRPVDLEKPDEPFPLPVMTGGAYAIRRDYFIELGGYDKGLKVWNGENFEMSFKLWLCGGKLLEVPCSHVAHTSKLRSKYREVDYGFDFSARNLKRVAEVWMDDYKENLYKSDPKRYALDPGDLTEAFAIKKRLNCKPFKYFMEEVAPEIVLRYPPYDWGNFATGAIVSEADPTLCISFKNRKFEDPLELTLCSENKTQPYMNQHFMLTWNRFIKFNDVNMKCIDANELSLLDCHFSFGNQLWKIDKTTRQISNPPTGVCISGDIKTWKLSTAPCNSSDINQKFNWGYLNVTAVENWDNYGIKLPV